MRLGPVLAFALPLLGAAAAPEAAADDLWPALRDARLVGPGAVNTVPHAASPPHGAMVETFFSAVAWRGRVVPAVVLRDYGPPGISAVDVMKNRARHLESIAVMVRDPEGGGWTWSHYAPEGSVLPDNPADCAACHRRAPGGDFLYSVDATP